MPVAEFQLFPGKAAHAAVRHEKLCAFQNILHLAAVSAGIHDQRAADRARNARGKGEAAEPRIRGRSRQFRKQCPRFGFQPVSVHFDGTEALAETYDSAAKALVADQEVRAVTDDCARNALCLATRKQGLELFGRFRLIVIIRRAADSKTRVAGERLLFRLSSQAKSSLSF